MHNSIECMNVLLHDCFHLVINTDFYFFFQKRDPWTNRRMDQLTNEQTDRPSYRNARTHLIKGNDFFCLNVWTTFSFNTCFYTKIQKQLEIAWNGSFLCSIRGPIKLRAYFWPSMFKLGFILIVVLTFCFKIERTISLHPSKCPWKHTIC